MRVSVGELDVICRMPSDASFAFCQPIEFRLLPVLQTSLVLRCSLDLESTISS
jgi:hypothetical protein